MEILIATLVARLSWHWSSMMEELEKLQIENAANARTTLARQDLEAEQSEYEQKLASLREEKITVCSVK
jgi:regulator of replication initiation timing